MKKKVLKVTLRGAENLSIIEKTGVTPDTIFGLLGMLEVGENFLEVELVEIDVPNPMVPNVPLSE